MDSQKSEFDILQEIKDAGVLTISETDPHIEVYRELESKGLIRMRPGLGQKYSIVLTDNGRQIFE